MKAEPVRIIFAALALASLTACASSGASRTQASLVRPIDAAAVYSGVWYEVARSATPETAGCVASEARFERDKKRRLTERDSCRMTADRGKERVSAGQVKILNRGVNTKFRTSYVYALNTDRREYWIVDHGDGWYIRTEPKRQTLSIFARNPNPDPSQLAMIMTRAKAFGDVALLEFPQPTGAGPALAAADRQP
jgi:apolipoprotein D and lipocalin family protein